MTIAGVALWGLHMGFSQGLLAVMVDDAAPPQLKGSGVRRVQFAQWPEHAGRERGGRMLWQEYKAAVTISDRWIVPD